MTRKTRRNFLRNTLWMSPVIAALPHLSWTRPQYRQPAAKDYINILEDPHRIGRLKPDQIIDALDLKPNHVVADIGAGSGLFTRPLAREVGEHGWVYAVDIDAELLRHVSTTADEESIANITTVLGKMNSPGLPVDSVDLVFLCDTLHHINKKQVYLSGVKKVLKPGARLALIDFAENWPAGHESMEFGDADLQRWVAATGFEKIAEHRFIDDNFFHIYRTP